MADDCLRRCLCLVPANKQDLPGSMPADKIADGLSLRSLGSSHPWYVQPCSAVVGDGLYEGLEWIRKTLAERRSAAHAA